MFKQQDGNIGFQYMPWQVATLNRIPQQILKQREISKMNTDAFVLLWLTKIYLNMDTKKVLINSSWIPLLLFEYHAK